ncbi:sodium ion-translocating decarboxylase subunit beta [Chlorobium phaeovibrioides]|uniref:Sodium ion-translocating decarboxylase subunit beta n=1 Tax=Chlorobium phaeovibrioides TaxID=1094 RepID=A0A432AXE2_CHLPH|nr:sodium ion-translocating decarboxylase subunit beta [Chlorobium phaeovibrioides]KAA6232704.1 sodium ion-translocating decarboxylase subunit beta [Chlorobium phaeovibrioides]MWV53786.1 sodium ion-translocating decarboxylase subunit beta [Chlorobium phaeovibrioides]QEQ56904.1 sodium ion-translocating decarboxylase subunit beta [Chlorobium phaeovibrioides]RTY37358.1 sodium ion-translocating decarboxylase subunit beta [Chlorobium phaeovibrioides]RTY39853.1 sodium ion-translocating decarboxylase
MRKLLLVVFSLLLFSTAGYSQTFFQTDGDIVTLQVPDSLELVKVPVRDSRNLRVGDAVKQGDFLALFANERHDKISVTAGVSGHITYLNTELFHKYSAVPAGTVLMRISQEDLLIDLQGSQASDDRLSIGMVMKNLVESTGVYSLVNDNSLSWTEGFGRILMISVGILLIWLAIAKGFEPLLLIPIGMGAILSNIPLAYISDEGGILFYVFHVGIETGVFPLLIFMGVGAMTDFGPMIANPKTGLLGGAAQVGIFSTLIGALLLSQYVPGIEFSMKDAASIGIIGGADGPTSIFVASRLSPALLGSIAVAAYSYMALVPIIQPPIMRMLTTKAERQIKMSQLRYVSKREKIIFPVVVIVLSALLLPSAAPLIGFLMFGNLMKECGVVERLSETTQNSLINIVTIFLGLGVGSKLSAEKFLNLETLGILVLGLIAFSVGTAGGVFMAKFMNLFLKQKINPLIGSAGVSAVPMAARVSNKVGLEYDPHNFLLMHAMGPNVSGVIGSAVAAGVLLAVFM